jgi:adenylate cyclase
VVEEAAGDLMGDGVNIAARLEGVAQPGAICLSEQAYWQVKGRLDLKVSDLGATQLKNIAEPIHVSSLEVGQPALSHLARRGFIAASYRLPKLLNLLNPSSAVRQVMSSKNAGCDNALACERSHSIRRQKRRLD